MALQINLNGSAGAGFARAATPSTLQSKAIAAMQAGDVRGFVFPTNGTSEDYMVVDPDAQERYVQDALFPQIEYKPNSYSVGVPSTSVSSVTPSMSWAGNASARGWRSERMDQMDNGIGGNPDLWMFAVLKWSTGDASIRVAFGANDDFTGFGESILRNTANSLEIRLGDSQSFPAAAIPDPNNWHIYAMRYTADNDTLRVYIDGALVHTSVVQIARPGTVFEGGNIFFGGYLGSLAQGTLNLPGSAFGCGGAGNGAMTDAQYADVVAWLKSVYSIA